MPGSETYRLVNAYLGQMRPYNALPLMLAFTIAFLLSGGHFGSRDVALGLLGIVATLGGLTIWNDIEDYEIDSANGRASGLLDGIISRQEATTFYRLLLLIGAIAFLQLHSHLLGGTWVLLFMGSGWAYNKRPFLLSHRPVASITLLGFLYGTLPFIAGYLLGHEYTLTGAFLALAWGSQRASIVIMKDYKDESGDRKHGKQTFYLRFGPRATALSSIGLLLAGLFGIGILLLFHSAHTADGVRQAAVLLATTCGIGLLALRFGLLRARNNKSRIRIFQRSFYLQNAFDMVVLLCII